VGRGLLQVYLGAAPGVGKTFSMLEEGRRLRQQGHDVVIGLVESHGREATASLAEGFEQLARVRVTQRSLEVGELDVDGLAARRPEWALIDELAHSNPPGALHEKRWQDVDMLLEAGISVISTVNVQHIESLNDVVRSITGVPQRETVPDSMLRAAEQIELVDLAPDALRDRLARGLVYPAVTIDAALSNYFRVGNLTALRELALLWLADDVDVALQEYRDDHGIRGRWEARERVVVALPGGAVGDTLIRRGARIASRTTGGQLLALHVASPDGLVEPDPGSLVAQRALAESLGGTYHQVVADDVATALTDFARGVNATQLVIGFSRRGRLAAFLGRQGVGATVIRASGDIDVHIVSHARDGSLELPRSRSALTLRRRVAGFVLAVVGIPLLTLALSGFRSDDTLVGDVLAFQLLVVVVALLGGIWPAVVSAVVAGLCLDFFFVEPLYTIRIATPAHATALVIYLIVAVLVSLVVDQAATRSRAARRSAAEAETLATVAGSIIRGENAVEALANRLREAFGLSAVTVFRGEDRVFEAGATTQGTATATVEFEGGSVVLAGREVPAADRRVLDAFVSQIAAALEQERLRTAASGLRPLEEADRLRTALLAAVGHDLRTPLASATASVSSLRSTDVTWSDHDRDELLETADISLHRLADLVADLLDASRLQAGVLPISLGTTGLEEVVPLALDELGTPVGTVEVDLPAGLPAVVADAVLLQRVVVNLVSNAVRFSPAGTAPSVAGSAFGGSVELRVVDHGPGIPPSRLAEAFQPFQRLGDTDNSTGIGLGLALSNGFMTAMGGSLHAEQTPGGGLTMVMSLPAAAERGVIE
jgi:two-component system sensor histidine kinase KdpD